MGLLMVWTALVSNMWYMVAHVVALQTSLSGFEEVHALFINLWAPLDIGQEQ